MARNDLQQVVDYVSENGPVSYKDLKALFPSLVTNQSMSWLRQALKFYMQGREHMVEKRGE